MGRDAKARAVCALIDQHGYLRCEIARELGLSEFAIRHVYNQAIRPRARHGLHSGIPGRRGNLLSRQKENRSARQRKPRASS